MIECGFSKRMHEWKRDDLSNINNDIETMILLNHLMFLISLIMYLTREYILV